jgi:hypothetical protein
MYQFIDEMDMWKLVEKIHTITRMLEKRHYKGKIMRGEKNIETVIFNWNDESTVDSLVYLNYSRN